jgi:hypothetical protein
MKYLLTFHMDQRRLADADPQEMKEAIARWNAFDAEAVEAGAMIACEPLQDSSNATTLSLADGGQTVVIDGPFAETKEQLAGFCLLECPDLDAALAWARKVPMDRGSIQVSPVQDFSQQGYESPTPAPFGAAS